MHCICISLEYFARFCIGSALSRFFRGGYSNLCKWAVPLLPFTSSPFSHCPLPFTLEVGPLKPGRESVSSPSAVWGGAPAENEFGAL